MRNKKKDKRPKIIKKLDNMSREEILENSDRLKRKARMYEGGGILIILLAIILFILLGNFSVSW